MSVDPTSPACATSRAADDLLLRVATGDREAFAELYRLAAPRVLGLARRTVVDPDLAEDVTQEVFAWLWRHADRFDPAVGTARAWIATITQRRAIDVVRLEESWRRRQRQDLETCFDSTVEAVLTTDLLRGVGVGVDRLTVLQQQAVRLAYGDQPDEGYASIADRLEVKLTTFRSRIHSAVTRLRAELAETDPA